MANPSSFLCATVVDDEQWSQKFLASESSLEQPQCRPPSVAVDRSCIATVYSEITFEFSRPFLMFTFALTGLATICIFVLFRWRKRNHLSYLRTKSNYEASNLASGTMAASTLPPERLSEHPLIYDDANIHFYRTSGTSTYLLDSSRGPSRSTMVRDISSLSSQVH